MGNNTSLDRDEFPDNISEDELRATLVDRNNVGRARLALKALSRRQSQFAFIEAQSILKETGVSDELRSVAAIELGRHSTAVSQETLIEVISDATPRLLKHVAKSLGQIGQEAALEKMERLAVPLNTPADIALRFAKTLISYRLGLQTYLLEPIRETMVDVSEAGQHSNLEFRKLDKVELKAALPLVRRQLPAISVDSESALRFTCGSAEHWMLFNEAVVRTGTADALGQRPMVAGAILKYRACSDNHSIDEYILTNGGGKAKVTLIGVRPSGVIVHAGFMYPAGRTAKFEVLLSQPRYSRAIELRGDLDLTNRRVSFTKALIGTSQTIAGRPSIPKRRVLNQ
jgi:hypothetical protein